MSNEHETMTLENAIKMLEEEYERAKEMDFVKKPLAYALHTVWREVDRDRQTKRGSIGGDCSCVEIRHSAYGTVKAEITPTDSNKRCALCGGILKKVSNTGTLYYCPTCYDKTTAGRRVRGVSAACEGGTPWPNAND